VDDEQGPWWTRPPEPGTQAPPVLRQRTSGPNDVDVEVPPSAYAPPAGYPRPRLVAPEPVEPEPEPEPEPVAVPKPVVRRVAVVQPTPPPVRTVGQDPRDQRTETLPSVGDDIFATFSGPLSVDTDPPAGARNGSGSPQTAGHNRAGDPLEEPEADRPGLLPHVQLPEPRVLLLIAAAALVIVLIVVVALVSGRGGTNPDPAAGGPTAVASPASGAIDLQGKNPDGLKQLGAEDATAQLRKAGEGPGGSIVEAWSWKDKNGQNLVVTSIAPAGKNKRTLRVIHVAGLEGKPRTLRVMKDPNLPTDCKGNGTAGFTPKSLIVRDLDGNNLAEVISGWTSRCGGKQAESQIKLALITDGEKYILRGQGVIGQAGGAFTPAPRAANWPDGFLTALKAQYRKLYG